MTAHTSESQAERALRKLHSEADKLTDIERELLLAHLGHTESHQKRNGKEKRAITDVHNHLPGTFIGDDISGEKSDGEVLGNVIKE